MTAGIMGVGFYAPARVVTNQELVTQGLQTSDEWIVEHTGIRTRHIADPEEATSDLAVAAARSALAAAALDPSAIDMIVCATSTPDHPLPSTASLVQHRLGSSAGAFDLNAGCSGFLYALNTGFALQEQGGAEHVLVIGADTYSRCLDWEDRTSAIFFGDGAGAVVLGPSAKRWLLASCHGSDGAGMEHITIPAGGSRLPATEARVRDKLTNFRMQGKDVWVFVREIFPKMVCEVTKRAGVKLQDVKLVIPHQANKRLLLTCADDLGIDSRRMFINVDEYANTASASVAIALAEAVQSCRIIPGDIVVLVGFGAGLSWAASCLEWA